MDRQEKPVSVQYEWGLFCILLNTLHLRLVESENMEPQRQVVRQTNQSHGSRKGEQLNCDNAGRLLTVDHRSVLL